MSTKSTNLRKTGASPTRDEPSFRDLMEQTDSRRDTGGVRQRTPAPTPSRRRTARSEPFDLPVDTVETPDEFRRDGLQDREMNRLRKGKFHVDDRERIDLHGLRRGDAHRELDDFLERCSHRGSRHALVICGKGHHSPHGKPVLKSFIRHLLIECDQVLAYCPASRRDGGDGALYVLLSKRRGKSQGTERRR